MTIRVFDQFSDCILQDATIGAWLKDGGSVRMGVEVPHQSQLRDAASRQGDELNLRALKATPDRTEFGRVLTLDDGRVMNRLPLYALADIGGDAAIDAARALMSFIAERHRPGRIWFAATPSYLQRRSKHDAGAVGTRMLGVENDDPELPPVFIGDPRRRVLVGCYYFHEATAKEPA